MKTIAFALLAFAAVGGLYAQPQLNYLSLNEGLTLTYDPGSPEDPQPQPYRVDWWVHSGRAYYLEATADLEHEPWHLLPKALPSYFVGDYSDTFRLNITGPKYFIRLRYVEGRRGGLLLQNSTIADTDHDGVSDNAEFYAPSPTHPLQSPMSITTGCPMTGSITTLDFLPRRKTRTKIPPMMLARSIYPRPILWSRIPTPLSPRINASSEIG